MTTNQQKYISHKEANALIRKELKLAFPKIKFQVYKTPGGGATYVRWVDGPSKERVEALIGMFRSGGFDGMTDSSYHYYFAQSPDGDILNLGHSGTGSMPNTVQPVPEGWEPVTIQLGFLFIERKYTRRFLERAMERHGHMPDFQDTKITDSSDEETAYIENVDITAPPRPWFRLLHAMSETDLF